MSLGRMNKFVTLTHLPAAEADAKETPLVPSSAWCSLVPQLSPGDNRSTEYLIELRYHPGVTLDTVVTFVDPVLQRTRKFYTRAVQNVNEANDLMRLIAEEIAP